MSAHAEAIVTAGLRPELFAGQSTLTGSRVLVFMAVAALILAGFGFRVTGLSAEGLSEDELNKLNTVAEYRSQGLTGSNGEHPMLMKALQTASIVLVEQWNNRSFVRNRSADYIPPEAALRLPGVILGALTALLIYLIAAELFGAEIALIAAALWAFDPNAIGFNRVAKEDSFLLFFFLLANVFWLRGQRVAESTDRNPNPFYWAAAAAFGAMVASKYLPHLLAISFSYYWMFQKLPETRWRLGTKRVLTFFTIMGIVFLILSPTILLPDTWRQMGLFAGNKTITHDGYEFMNRLYSHRLSDWLQGIPPHFYVVFTWVKLPLLTLVGFLLGLPLLFRRKLGDGRYLVLWWLYFFFFAFSFLGGKFTRYYTVALPAVLITSALGVHFTGRWLADKLSLLKQRSLTRYISASLAILVITASVIASAQVAPHFRLFVNTVGGGESKAGYYFPHDEFYDASMRDVMVEIAKHAQPGARVASESSSLASHYAQRAQRTDLEAVSLSDHEGLRKLRVGDYLIVARGRRYFSNDALVKALQTKTPEFRFFLGDVPSTDVFIVNDEIKNLLMRSFREIS